MNLKKPVKPRIGANFRKFKGTKHKIPRKDIYLLGEEIGFWFSFYNQRQSAQICGKCCFYE